MTFRVSPTLVSCLVLATIITCIAAITVLIALSRTAVPASPATDAARPAPGPVLPGSPPTGAGPVVPEGPAGSIPAAMSAAGGTREGDAASITRLSTLARLATVDPAPVVHGPCVASWYGDAHRGLPTASGVPFDPDGLTVAVWDLPFGTVLEVTHGMSTVEVVVNDRGPARPLGRCLDLSRAAFAALAPLGAGLIDVTWREVS